MAQAYDAATTKERFAKPDIAAAARHFCSMIQLVEYGDAISHLTRALEAAIDYAVARVAGGCEVPTAVCVDTQTERWSKLDLDVIDFGLRRVFPGWDVECHRTHVMLVLK
jgi:hypothetical protein